MAGEKFFCILFIFVAQVQVIWKPGVQRIKGFNEVDFELILLNCKMTFNNWYKNQ